MTAKRVLAPKGYQKLSFLATTTTNATETMQACEKILQESLIPFLIGKDNLGCLNIKLTSGFRNGKPAIF